MSEENEGGEGRRIYVGKPIARRSQIAKPVLSQSAQDMLDDAMSIISYEMVRLKQKVMKDPMKGLDGKDAKILQGYIKSLVDLLREERERTDSADYANMSDEELLALFENLKKKKEIARAESGNE